jgi:hypothetical protein
MKEDLIADLWNVMIGHIPEKQREDVAYDFVNVLMDYGVKETTIESLQGIDPHLDKAIEYVIDGEEIEDDADYDGYDEEE